jgi:hypothetical protein
MIVLSWSKATRNLLKSFSWGIRALRQLFAGDDGAISSPPAPYHLSVPLAVKTQLGHPSAETLDCVEAAGPDRLDPPFACPQRSKKPFHGLNRLNQEGAMRARTDIPKQLRQGLRHFA